MRITKRAVGAAGLATIALLATACSSGTTTNPGSTSSTAAVKTGGEITVRGCTPQNPLVGSMTGEVCGGNVIDWTTSKLIHYNTENAAPENDVAESIETSDSTTFTVKLKKGQKFSDGSEIKAKNFVDAWNIAAYGPNGHEGSYFFESFKGYDDVQCGTGADGASDCTGKPPAVKEMSGLKVVDDHTFTIEMASPTSNLPVRLGYSAFAPGSDKYLTDPANAEYGKVPLSSGPYKVVTNTATEIVLEKNDQYAGERKGQVDKITYRLYNDANAAWTDVVANNLDFTDIIPAGQLAGDAWRTQLGEDRTSIREAGVIEVMTFSPADEQLKTNAPLRKAISQAIDRATITKQIYNGTRTPATGWVSPVVDGYKADQCGENCTYDAAKAKSAFQAAGGYQGTFTLTVNQDGGHKPWADAVCNGLKNDLGMDCVVGLTPDFRTLLNQAKAGELKGAFRNGWQMDYPSIENFLTPIYAKGAGSNYSKYDSPTFEAKLKEAAAATDVTKANTLYQEAESILSNDFPTAPLWYRTQPAAWSDKVTNVKVNAFGVVDVTSITVK